MDVFYGEIVPTLLNKRLTKSNPTKKAGFVRQSHFKTPAPFEIRVL